MGNIEKIRYYQRRGFSYNKTAELLGEKLNTVKTYYRRNPPDNSCLCCGAEIPPTKAHRKKLFCSDKCRYTWWYKNRDLKSIPNPQEVVCATCGKVFIAKSSAKRKFCSLTCHYSARKEAHQDG